MEYRLKDYERIIREVLDSNGEFVMYPKGTSMLPLIVEKRDSVTLVKPKKTLGVRDIILYKREDGSFVLHRILGKNQQGYILCGDNQEFLEYGITDGQVIGMVKIICRKGKTITRSKLGVRLYEHLWCVMLVRKIYFRLLGHRYSRRIRKNDKKQENRISDEA